MNTFAVATHVLRLGYTVQIDAGKKMGADYILLIQAVYEKGGIDRW